MNNHEYFREKYDREIEMHKFGQIPEKKLKTKDVVLATIGAIAFAPVLYFGTIGFMALIYAVTGVR